MNATATTNTARLDEIRRFNRLAATWWNARGPMRPLHVTNGLRLELVLAQIAQHFGRAPGDLTGLRIADVGCGAGLMCEPLARRGAVVVGVDAAEKNIAAARLHAHEQHLAIDYRVGDNSALAEEHFDVMLVLEVVEHVDDVAAFVGDATRRLDNGGLLFASTINRTARSWLLAIVGAEYLFRILPVGTHRWRQFVTPAELDAAMAAHGLQPIARRGMRYIPVLHRAWWTSDTSVNYLATYAATQSAADFNPV